MPKARISYYAVRHGAKPGIYLTWDECRAQVIGFPNSQYKKFDTRHAAEAFINGNGIKGRSTAPQRSSSMQSASRKNITAATTKVVGLQTDADDTREVVYTDGASSGNGKRGAKAGYGVFWGDNDPRNQGGALPGDRQTNQRAELYAIIRAIEQSINGETTLEICTDSQYSINCAEAWSKLWINNGWKSKRGVPVENRDLVEHLLDLRKSRPGKVVFTYVPGHSGVHGNEMADRLAVRGAASTT